MPYLLRKRHNGRSRSARRVIGPLAETLLPHETDASQECQSSYEQLEESAFGHGGLPHGISQVVQLAMAIRDECGLLLLLLFC